MPNGRSKALSPRNVPAATTACAATWSNFITGGIYNLYKYRRYQDLRLVFAPEFAIAFFGGDPDNFEFPRYDLDVSFVRIYDERQAARFSRQLSRFRAGRREGGRSCLTVGHPGSTERLDTVAELEFDRDVPCRARSPMSELRGLLNEFSTRAPSKNASPKARCSGSRIP